VDFRQFGKMAQVKKVTHSTILALALFQPHLIRSRIEATQNNHAHISYDGSDA
jgi:hypothetical protein